MKPVDCVTDLPGAGTATYYYEVASEVEAPIWLQCKPGRP